MSDATVEMSLWRPPPTLPRAGGGTSMERPASALRRRRGALQGFRWCHQAPGKLQHLAAGLDQLRRIGPGAVQALARVVDGPQQARVVLDAAQLRLRRLDRGAVARDLVELGLRLARPLVAIALGAAGL